MELTSFAVYCPCSKCRGVVRQNLIKDPEEMAWVCPISGDVVCNITEANSNG